MGHRESWGSWENWREGKYFSGWMVSEKNLFPLKIKFTYIDQKYKVTVKRKRGKIKEGRKEGNKKEKVQNFLLQEHKAELLLFLSS